MGNFFSLLKVKKKSESLHTLKIRYVFNTTKQKLIHSTNKSSANLAQEKKTGL